MILTVGHTMSITILERRRRNDQFLYLLGMLTSDFFIMGASGRWAWQWPPGPPWNCPCWSV